MHLHRYMHIGTSTVDVKPSYQARRKLPRWSQLYLSEGFKLSRTDALQVDAPPTGGVRKLLLQGASLGLGEVGIV